MAACCSVLLGLGSRESRCLPSVLHDAAQPGVRAPAVSLETEEEQEEEEEEEEEDGLEEYSINSEMGISVLR